MKDPVRHKLFYGWVIVAVGGLVSFVQAGAWNPVLSVFIKPMEDAFGWDRASISGAVTIGALGGAFLSVIVGPVVDKRGAKVILVPAVAILGVAMAMTSRITQLWHFYLLFGVSRMLAAGATSLAINVAVANWFIEKRGRALGAVLLARGAGTALSPLLIQFLIVVQGWRSAWLALGVIILAVGIIPSAVFVKRRPEDLGLRPDGKRPVVGTEASSVRSDSALEAQSGSPPEPSWTRSEAIRTPALWLLTLAASQTFMAGGGTNLHQIPFLIDRGVPGTAAVGALSVFALCSAVSGLVWSFVAERIHVRYCLMVALFATSLAVVFLLTVRTVAMAYVYAVFYGIALGGQVALMSLAWPVYFGRMSLGAIRGLVSPFQWVANAIGPLFAGWVVVATGSYQPAFLTFAVLHLLAVVWVALARVPEVSHVQTTR